MHSNDGDDDRDFELEEGDLEDGLALEDGDACLVIRKDGEILCVVPDMEDSETVDVGDPALTVHVLMWLLKSDRWSELEQEFVTKCQTAPKPAAKKAPEKKLLN